MAHRSLIKGRGRIRQWAYILIEEPCMNKQGRYRISITLPLSDDFNRVICMLEMFLNQQKNVVYLIG